MTLISIKWLHETKMYQVSVVPLKVPYIEFYSMLGFRCMCLELHAVNTYIKVEFDVWYFQ